MDGYRQGLEAGLTYDPSMVLVGNYSLKSGYKQAEAVAWLIRQGRTDAVIAANDRMAIGLLQGLKELGLQVGKDVALIGCDDSDGARLTDPPLSSIQVPFYEVGCTAASNLLDTLSDPGRSSFAVKLPVKLVERASSAPVAFTES